MVRKRVKEEPFFVYPKGFVKMENELSLYNLLAYSENPELKVSPVSMDIYRRLKQHRNTSDNETLKGRAWVSMERLALELGITRKTVSKHLHILEKVELINIHRFYRGGRKRCEYSFNAVMTEKAFKKKYPEVFVKLEEKIKEIERVEEVESWYKPDEYKKEKE